MIRVIVPATSANVGPGFDCMGVAVSAYATFTFALQDSGLKITGCDPKWQNEQNLVIQGFDRVLKELGEQRTGLSLKIDASEIPEARGLGSSAVCLVAGAMGANALYGNRFSKQELLNFCTELEGHPDNVAPAVFGGLTVSFCQEGVAHTVRYEVAKQLYFCAMIPDYPILTKAARAVLPKTVTYEDAVFNIGRCAALAQGLSLGDKEIIKYACDDRLHQPYRKVLFPDYEAIQALCEKHEVLTWYISGSGSTMMAITDQETIADALLDAVQRQFPAWLMKKLSVDPVGTRIEEA